ncbi:MAG: hypothetical protein PWP05_404 [Thermovirga sp.]|nr:hypothetical protein [Thermovirga sp.]MDN5367689.1 hypothetical protein [Thermovirga sp.]
MILEAFKLVRETATVFLESCTSDYINDRILCVDGGWLAR